MKKRKLDGGEVRRVLLEVIEESDRGGGSLQSQTVLQQTARRIRNGGGVVEERVLLTIFHDLMRSGHLAWGSNLSNIAPPFMHVTRKGRRALESLSRDPVNPDGYLAALGSLVEPGSIARSYIEEGLRTYNNDCYKATAVMVGAASEALLLELRDALVAKMEALGHTVPKALKDWRVKTVRDAITKVLDQQAKSMDRDLRDQVTGFWLALTEAARRVRNDAGHPKSVAPVSPEEVHATLLLFHQTARLVHDLRAWISSGYS